MIHGCELSHHTQSIVCSWLDIHSISEAMILAY